MEIYERIRALREDADLKQEVIAKYLNMKQTNYSTYELGKHKIPVEMVIALAKYYNVTSDYILGLSNKKR